MRYGGISCTYEKWTRQSRAEQNRESDQLTNIDEHSVAHWTWTNAKHVAQKFMFHFRLMCKLRWLSVFIRFTSEKCLSTLIVGHQIKYPLRTKCFLTRSLAHSLTQNRSMWSDIKRNTFHSAIKHRLVAHNIWWTVDINLRSAPAFVSVSVSAPPVCHSENPNLLSMERPKRLASSLKRNGIVFVFRLYCVNAVKERATDRPTDRLSEWAVMVVESTFSKMKWVRWNLRKFATVVTSPRGNLRHFTFISIFAAYIFFSLHRKLQMLASFQFAKKRYLRRKKNTDAKLVRKNAKCIEKLWP